MRRASGLSFGGAKTSAATWGTRDFPNASIACPHLTNLETLAANFAAMGNRGYLFGASNNGRRPWWVRPR
jgi:hypothetical protein